MDVINRQAAIKDAESWVAIDEYEKHLQRDVIEWLKGFPSAEHGTNLAEVGTDCISRQAAIDALERVKTATSENGERWIAKINAQMELEQLPSAQPEIIRCRNCKFASGDSRICMKFGHSPIGELDFCAWAERRTDEQMKD